MIDDLEFYLLRPHILNGEGHILRVHEECNFSPLFWRKALEVVELLAFEGQFCTFRRNNISDLVMMRNLAVSPRQVAAAFVRRKALRLNEHLVEDLSGNGQIEHATV